MFVSRSSEAAHKVRFWSSQARDPDPEGVCNYVHSEPGYNYALSNVLAAIILAQMDTLTERVAARRRIAFRYRDAFHEVGLELMPQACYGLHTNWLSCFLVDEAVFGLSRNTLIKHLESLNIETRPVWKPMHLQPLYSSCEVVGGEVAQELNARGICLPSSSALSEEDQSFVIQAVHDARRSAIRGFQGN